MADTQSTPPAQKAAPYSSSAPHPYACFRCRKSFKRASRVEAVLPCPNCGGPSIGLTRKFKPPKSTDAKQWKKVEALVRHGFLFWSLSEPYPETLEEVPAFALRHASFVACERANNPEAFAQIDAALSLET
ncbi:hypothetical protein [Parasphingorhabdus marina]|nr:hypothetical protein [Parasphingorhabdus marina]